jgi:hypothetical protein
VIAQDHLHRFPQRIAAVILADNGGHALPQTASVRGIGQPHPPPPV